MAPSKTTKVEVQFVLGTGISSSAIAWFGGGAFSHVDAVMPDKTLIGARSDVIYPLMPDGTTSPKPIPPGVQRRPANYERWKTKVVASLVVPTDKANKFYDLNISQIGKAYDTTAIWGFVTGRDWRDPRDWFCSELQSWCFEGALILPKLSTPINKINPSTLYFGLSTAGFSFA